MLIRYLKFFSYKTKRAFEILLLPLLPKSLRYKKIVFGKVSYSQAGQDIFVQAMLKDKKNGFYVELGAFDAVWSSNTYFLEAQLGWRGISFEIVGSLVKKFNQERKNKCFEADATKLDYLALFEKEDVPCRVDYLSLDIEPAEQTLATLKALPLDSYRFSVITYEHDRYVSGESCMNMSREILEKHGYVRVVSNLSADGRDFEDWYIDPEVVDEANYKKIISSNIEYQKICELLKG